MEQSDNNCDLRSLKHDLRRLDRQIKALMVKLAALEDKLAALGEPGGFRQAGGRPRIYTSVKL
ncbi:hypothetical protein [Paenibacillus sp. GCM10023250]|uniref:hypothetical protein n=1 Tax=Paenibacillus sp. GCM10023250 TaxID=3252648 RepID=UPI003609ACA7